jgi:hypothetical protein
MRTYGKENFFQLKIRCAMHGLGDLLSGRTFKALLHLAASVTNGDKRAQKKKLKDFCNWNKSIKE